MAESYSVQAILSAVDKGFRKTMQDAKNQAEQFGNENKKANASMLDIAKGVGVFKLVEAGIKTVTNSVGGAISRFDTLNKYPVVMQALGYSTDEVTSSMGKLDKGIDGLPTSMDEIVASTQQIAIATGDLEKGTATAISLNNAFLASGSSSADAARGAEQYRQMLARGEVDMQSWRSVVDTMPVAMDQVAKSFEDRGVTSANELYDALKEGHITFDEFNDKLIEMYDTGTKGADLARKNSEGIKTSFANLRTAVVKGVEKTIRAVNDAMKDAGLGSIAGNLDNLKGLINQFFGWVVSIMPTVIEKILELFETIKKVSEALKPYAPILVEIVAILVTFRVLLDIKNMVMGVMNSFKLFFGVLAANPIVLLISVIAAMVGSIIYLWKTNEDFRNAVIEIWGNIKEFITGIPGAIKDAWSGVKEWFSDLWNTVKETASESWEKVKEVWTGAVEWFEGKIQEISDFFTDGWNTIVSNVTEFKDKVIGKVTEMYEVMKTKVTKFTDAVKEPLQPIIDAFTDTFDGIKTFLSSTWENIKTLASSAWELIKNVILGPVLFITSIISGGWEEAKNNMIAVWGNIKENAQLAWESIVNIIKGAMELIVTTITDIGNGILETVSNIGTLIFEKVTELWSGMVEKTKEFWTNLVDDTKGKWANMKESIKENVTNAKNAAIEGWANLKEDTKTKWEDMKQNTSTKWSEMKTDTANKTKEIANAARESWENMRKATREKIDKVKGILKSLSEIDLRQVGKDVINGFIEGITSMFRAVKDTIKNLASMVTDGLKDILKIKSPSRVMMGISKWIPAGVAKGIEDNTKQVDKAMADMVDTDLVNPIADDLNNAFNSVGKTSLSNEMNINHNNQPAYINLSLGGQNFKAFVENIGSTMGQEADLLAQY